MANNSGSQHQSRLPLGLLTSVLLLGTLLAWWGTRDGRRMFGEAVREPIATEGMVLPQVTEENGALLDRGSQISQRQCAGCHEGTTRSSAPSYWEIVSFYRREVSNSAGDAGLRSRIASAVTHPRPGWGNFAPGPPESELSLEDRMAVASWILNTFDPEKKSAEGLGQ
jgi:cytochrome c551/c552